MPADQEVALRYFELFREAAKSEEDGVSILWFGKLVDQHSLPSKNGLRDLFRVLDRNKLGCLSRQLIGDQKWTKLFDKADWTGKGLISYWNMYQMRNSW